MTNINYAIDNIFVIPDEIRKRKGAENLHMIKTDGYDKFIHYNDALEIIKGYRFGGFDDWRLPTKDEVMAIFKDIKLIKQMDNSVMQNDIGAYNQRFSWFWVNTIDNPNSYFFWPERFRMFNQHDKNRNLESTDIEFKDTNPLRGHCSFFIVR